MTGTFGCDERKKAAPFKRVTRACPEVAGSIFPAVLIRSGRSRFLLFAFGRLASRNGIVAPQPVREIEIGTALGAKGTEARVGRFAAERTLFLFRLLFRHQILLGRRHHWIRSKRAARHAVQGRRESPRHDRRASARFPAKLAPGLPCRELQKPLAPRAARPRERHCLAFAFVRDPSNCGNTRSST